MHLEKRDLAWAKKQTAALESGGAAEGGDPGVELVLADGSVYPHRGVIVTVNRQIDPTTGTIQVQALAPNPDGLLRPGQYARARIRRTEAGHDELVVPERALISVQGTYSLAVVGPDNKVQLRKVELGPASKGLQIITKGVAEGDRIVVDGVQKVTDGATVDPRPLPVETAK
jgi:membrane fusion protein (multidrug efflux system)